MPKYYPYRGTRDGKGFCCDCDSFENLIVIAGNSAEYCSLCVDKHIPDEPSVKVIEEVIYQAEREQDRKVRTGERKPWESRPSLISALFKLAKIELPDDFLDQLFEELS